jgi:D-serine deaminase-like pyridoxal phosphate-dependent protein
VNGGGTGSLELTAEDPSVTETTAGSGFYAPALFDGYHHFRHLPAVAFALPVTRRPGPGLFTCQGGGYVASGAAGADRLPRPYLPEGMALLEQEGAGEVQTPFSYSGPEAIAIGDPVFFRHAKAGELCERFETLLLVENGRVVDRVPTYRGHGMCFG